MLIYWWFCLRYQVTPKRWNDSIIHPIPKGNETNYIDDFRPISIVCMFRKMFEKLLLVKYFDNKFTTDYMSRFQNAFRNKHSFVSTAIILDDMIRYFKRNIVVYIDLKSAYDSVIIERLLKVLLTKVDPIIWNLIRSLFLATKSKLIINSQTSKSFTKSNGLFQGSILSPLLFNLYINDLCEKLNNGSSNALFYADDIVVFGDNIDNVQKYVDIIQEWSKYSGIEINFNKTFTTSTEVLLLNQKVINYKDTVRYLGIDFDVKGIVFKNLINTIDSKFSSIIGHFGNYSSMLKLFDRIGVFKSFFVPFLNLYLPLVYLNVSRNKRSRTSVVKRLKEINKKVMHYVFDCGSDNHLNLSLISGIVPIHLQLDYWFVLFKNHIMNLSQNHYIYELNNNLVHVDKNWINKSNIGSVLNKTVKVVSDTNIFIDYKLFDKFKLDYKEKYCKYNNSTKVIYPYGKNLIESFLYCEDLTLRNKMLLWRRNLLYTTMDCSICKFQFNRQCFERHMNVYRHDSNTYLEFVNHCRINQKWKNYCFMDYLIGHLKYEQVKNLFKEINSNLTLSNRKAYGPKS